MVKNELHRPPSQHKSSNSPSGINTISYGNHLNTNANNHPLLQKHRKKQLQSRAREQKYFTIERRNLESQVPNRNKGRETDK